MPETAIKRCERVSKAVPRQPVFNIGIGSYVLRVIEVNETVLERRQICSDYSKRQHDRNDRDLSASDRVSEPFHARGFSIECSELPRISSRMGSKFLEQLFNLLN